MRVYFSVFGHLQMSSGESVFRLKDMDKGKIRLWMDVRLDRGQVKKTEEDSDSVKCHCTGG